MDELPSVLWILCLRRADVQTSQPGWKKCLWQL